MYIVNFTLGAITAITCLGCTLLLFRAYSATRTRLLLWSALCFICLTVNSTLLFLDLAVFPSADLRIYRLTSAFVGLLFLLYGFIWEAE